MADTLILLRLSSSDFGGGNNEEYIVVERSRAGKQLERVLSTQFTVSLPNCTLL
ncbi:MAG TPA: hypothetical protein V6D35_22010 [Candidatus Sericytochromatia bacterium]